MNVIFILNLKSISKSKIYFLFVIKMLSEAVEPAGVNMKLFHSDALTFPMGDNIDRAKYQTPWESDELPNVFLVGNLPFNIATPLLFKLLTKVSDRTGIFRVGRVPMTFMFQQEFGERMICPAGFNERSRV